MQVLIETRDPQALPLRDFAETRLRFALRRLSGWVSRAKVQLSDVNGPRGGVDKRCRIELHTAAGGPVVVSSVAHDWRAALADALGRAQIAALRLTQRRSGFARRRRSIDPSS